MEQLCEEDPNAIGCSLEFGALDEEGGAGTDKRAERNSGTRMTPLSGIKVLDFSQALAGPYCTLLLADYGADVYKIESPDGGDAARGWGPPFVADQASYFLGLNRGKRSVSVNLKCPQGIELCLRMMEKVDIVIENFRPGTMSRLGLGCAQARARNPRLIYCSISGYGQNGPSREEPAMDLNLQASTGLMSVTGTDDVKRVRCGYSVADVTSGMCALIGILMALRSRDISDSGQFVDVSMFDSMISAMTVNFMIYLGSADVPDPLGTSYSSIVPYRTFPTKDIDVAIAVGSEKLWRVFGPAIGHAELVDHPAYATNSMRVKNRGVLEPLLAEIFRMDTMENWLAKLRAAGVPASPIRRIDEVVNDPQSAARQMFPFVLHPTAGQLRVVGSPIKFSETPAIVSTSAPVLGQHTQETLSEWFAIDATELGQLHSAGVILQGEEDCKHFKP
jgi:crotonobetainyl-CoA:carnitine CoA-transferase CaiB-like acyl-CoA transferase